MEQKFCYYCMSAVGTDGTCPSCGLNAGTYQPAPHHIPPGTILMNRYLLGRVLGEGGFGITYLACDLRLDLKVAIKEYFPTDKATRHSASSLDVTSYTSSAADSYETNKRKFLSEARTMAKMEKQAEVVGVRDFFEVNNTAYIVMEFVDGTTFRDLVKQEGGRIPTAKLLKTIEPLFSALSAMHDTGLVHRDISPDNLMLEQGRVRLLDFGCARESATGTSTLTIALKHGYAPIEQYTNHGQGPWTDIYSLGATIYFCLTGKAPVRSTDRLLGDELILPSKLGIDLTREQEAALLRAMAIQPRRRFQSMEEFRAALYEAPSAPAEVPTTEHVDVTVCEFPPSEPAVPTGGATAVKAHADDKPNTKTQQKTPDRKDVPAPKSNRRLVESVLAVTAVIMTVVGIVFGVRSRQAEPVVPEETYSGDVYYDPAPTPVNDTAQPYTLDTSLAVHTENYQYFLDALADPEISEIHITGGGVVEAYEYVDTVISKPVYLEDAHMYCYFPVEIVEGGHLVVNGQFMSEGYIRTRGGGKVTAQEGSSVSVNGMLWLENRSDMNYDGCGTCHRWEFNEAAVAAAAAHVSTSDELRQMLDTTSVPIMIDSDMTISQGTWDISNRTVIISPGVSVTSETEAFNIYDGNLINYGTLVLSNRTGGILGSTDCHLVNFGTLQINMPESFYAQEECTVLNLGLIRTGAPAEAEIILGSNTINMGRIEAANSLTVGGFAVNSGSIAASTEKVTDFRNTDVLVNWGSITANSIENYGYILTGGNITAGYLYNVGLLDECTAYVSPEGEIYISSIDSSRGVCILRSQETNTAKGIVSHFASPSDAEYLSDYVSIATEADLLEYADSDYEWLVLTEDITCHQDLKLYRNLVIPQDVTLRFDTGKSLYVRGAQVSLFGSLVGDSLNFEDGAQLYVNGGNDSPPLSGYQLALRNGSACYLNYAETDVQKFILQDRSICIAHAGYITCGEQLLVEDDSRLMLLDGVRGVFELHTPELAASCSRITSLAEQYWSDMQINLHQTNTEILMPLTLSSCYVENGRESNIYNSWDGCLTVRNSTFINDGRLYEDGMVYLYCDTVNNGEITATDLYISDSFVNNKKVTLYGELIDHGNVYTGKEPIYIE